MRFLERGLPTGLLLLAASWLLPGCSPVSLPDDAPFVCEADGSCGLPEHVCSRERRCRPASEVLRLERPRQDTPVGSAGLPVEAFLDVEGYDPPSLILEANGPGAGGEGPPLHLPRRGPGVYAGHFTPETSRSGTYTLTVRDEARGLSSPPVPIEVDVEPPAFHVELASGERPEHPRDERVVLRVTSTAADVNPASVKLEVSGDTAGPGTFLPVRPLPCDAGYCGGVELDLATPRLEAVRGTLRLQVSGQDALGNPGTGGHELAVTREKWALDLGAPITSPPVVDAWGTVYLARGDQLVWVHPQGAVGGTAATGPLFGTPPLLAVGPVWPGGPRLLYFVERPATGSPRLVALDPKDGKRVASCTPTTGTVFHQASLALGTGLDSRGQRVEVALAAFRADQDRIVYVALRPRDAASPCVSVQTVLEAFDNLLASGSRFFAVTRTYIQEVHVLASALELGTPVCCPEEGMTLLAGQQLVGLSGSGLFTFRLSKEECAFVDVGGRADLVQRTTTVSADAAGRFFFGKQGDDGKSYLSRVSLGSGQLEVAEALADASPALVLGQGGQLYGSSADGQRLQVWTTELQPLWDWKRPLQVSLASTLDCARDSQGRPVPSHTGLWYVPDGRWLRALIVDSRGIDADAQWPLFRHDPQGTGNALTPLEPFRCPPPGAP